MRRALALGAAVALIGGRAVAADLDAPLAPAPPTLRSEIQRGWDASFGCGIKAPFDVGGQQFLDCVSRKQSANRQRMGRGYEAFDVGLWFFARRNLRVLVASAPNELSRAALAVAVAGLREAENATGTTDADAAAALKR